MNHSTTYIKNNGITLRAVEPADIDFIYLAENDAQAWNASAAVAPMSRLMIQQYIDTYRADLYADRQLRLIAINASSGERLGIADLYDFDPRNSRAGVGIYIAPSLRKQGYGKRVLDLLCHYAQDFIGIHNLYATIPTDNTPSRHIFAQCGFTEIATLPHWIKTTQGYTSAVFTGRIAE